MNEDYIFEDEEEVEKSTPFIQQEPPKQKIGLAVAALILGIFSLVFFLSIINIFTGISAIVLAIIFLVGHKGKAGKAYACIGLFTAIASIVMLIVSMGMIYSNIDNIVPIYGDFLQLYGVDSNLDYNLELDVDDTF